MHQSLIDHIDQKIADAANFVTKYMPVDITIDSAYEAILECSAHTDVMRKAFREAVKFLPPTANQRRFNFALSDGRVASVTARLTPTPTWPAFLMPSDSLTIDPESKLAALLDTPIRVATEWEQLGWVWHELFKSQFDLDNQQLAYLMPWIRECLADFDAYSLGKMTKTDRTQIEREVSTVMRDANVRFFPRMSAELNAVVRSGKVLFSQFRMIESAYAENTLAQSCIAVERTPSLIPVWIKEHMTEACEEWTLDINSRAAQKLEELVVRKAAQYDRMVRRGTRV